MTPGLRAAVVGTGFVAALHVDALRRLGIEVAGVVGSSRERAGASGLGEPYDSLEAMLADGRVDVVHLASPNHVHAEQARAALQAGKHVICEKPLGTTAAETAELLEQARGTGLVHATHFNLRFYPQVLEARARVRRGDLGAVRLLSGGYLQDWLLHATDWNWRLDPAVGGALRAVGDIGSHWVDMAGFLTGLRVEEVCADLHTFVAVRKRPTGPVETFAGKGAEAGETTDVAMDSDDAAGLLLRLDGGVRATCTLSQVSAGRRNRLHLQADGARGSLFWDQERHEELWLGHRDAPNELLLRDPALAAPEVEGATHLPAGHAEGYADTFRELYRAVYAAVAAGGPPDEPAYPTFADGHEQMLVGEAIARSARGRCWVTVER